MLKNKYVIGVIAFILFFAWSKNIIIRSETPENATYIGVESCRLCHSDIYKSWLKVGHGKTFELLKNAGEEKNEKCLPCHTTGYGKGGYKDESSSPDLKNVQCEACHGPGSDHNGDPSKINKVFSAAICANCHMDTDIHGKNE